MRLQVVRKLKYGCKNTTMIFNFQVVVIKLVKNSLLVSVTLVVNLNQVDKNLMTSTIESIVSGYNRNVVPLSECKCVLFLCICPSLVQV